MTLLPAYGRDYKTQKALMEDFNANKDFVITGLNDNGSFEDDGKYVNKEQLIGKMIQIRYCKATKVIGLRVK